MELLALILLLAGAAALIARFSRFHPLLIAGGLALPVALLITLAAGAFMSPAAPAIGLIAAVAAIWPAGLGAFVGWLFRKHRERH